MLGWVWLGEKNNNIKSDNYILTDLPTYLPIEPTRENYEQKLKNSLLLCNLITN